MRRSLAPSQQFRTVVTKKPKVSFPELAAEKENEGSVSNEEATSTLNETLKAIRKTNVTSKPNNEAKDTPIFVSQLDDNSSNDPKNTEHLRNNLMKDDGLHSNEVVSSVDDEVISKCKPKFVPPKRFISPLLPGQPKVKEKSNIGSDSESTSIADGNTSHYYSVVW